MTISYIPAGVPFLETLAEYILKETDPLQLMQYQILLPTQKSCEALKNILLKRQGRAKLLPKIQALGSLNAEDIFLQGGDAGLLKSTLSKRRRHLLLTNLIAVHRELSTENASLLANTLMQLLDTLAREGIPLEHLSLDDLVAADYALHWQVTGDFLKLIQQEWPKVLRAEEAWEEPTKNCLVLEEQARVWRDILPSHPIIIAGSRGSVPATAKLMKQVLALPQGHIILQGLVPSDCVVEISPTHPQSELYKLLTFLEVSPHAVPALAPVLNRPSKILEAAFQLESATLEKMENIALAECLSSQQEAEVIALTLRQVLEIPGKTGMLITPDSNLVRRVRMALQRWDIYINGSEGTPLSQTPLGSLCALTAQWINPDFDLGIFLATLKHSLIRTLPTNELEVEIIRKGAWSWELIKQKARLTTLEPFVQELDDLLKACQSMAKASHVSFETAMMQHQKLLEYFLETGLWPKAVEYAAEMERFWEELKAAGHSMTLSTGADYAKLMVDYLGQESYTPPCTHDRIHIFGLMDARLLQADVVILGGLNEGCWPQDLPADPWFNRATRKKLGISPPEERIGLSAHDFVQAGAASEILLTRSVRVEGTPTVPSSFLVKVQTWLQQQGFALPVAQHVLDWSMPLLETLPAISGPKPTPPLDARPQTLSISDMATWMQNPYGVYAKHVLGLRPLSSPFDYNSALTFGTMAHLVLQRILPLAQSKALNIWDTVEDIWQKFVGQFQPHEQVFWHWRLQQIVEWFCILPDNEKAQTSYVEAPGKIKVGDFTVVGKIDRIDLWDKEAHVIDYKTGTLPAMGFVKYGLSPQLLLETWMVQDGVMQALEPTPVASASLWRLPTGWQNDMRITLEGENLEVLLTQLKSRIKRLITTFQNPATPYLCHPRGRMYETPYDHLARFQEWATQDSNYD